MTGVFRPSVLFVCPFCKGECASGETLEDEKSPDGSGDPSVTHTMPTCDRFRDMEPDDFLALVNKVYGKG